MRNLKRLQKSRGFTLVELMIVVAIIGVLAALAIYGVSKYLGAAKSVEAKTSLGAIGKGNIAAYNKESMSPAVLAAGTAATRSNAICATAAGGPVPAAVPVGAKYQTSAADWNAAADIGTALTPPSGFPCLRFSMDSPQYYQYMYTGTNVGSGTDAMVATATGDVNGNTIQSIFTLNGAVQGGHLALAPAIGEINPDELSSRREVGVFG